MGPLTSCKELGIVLQFQTVAFSSHAPVCTYAGQLASTLPTTYGVSYRLSTILVHLLHVD